MGLLNINEFRQSMKHAGGWWEDLRMPANGASVGPQAPSWDTTNLGFILDDAPPAGNQELQFIAQVPHSWLVGSTIEVHVHWTLADDDGAADETVKWDLHYRVYETGDTIGGWTTDENPVDVSGNTQWESIYTDLVDIDMSGVTSVSSIIELRLERDTDDAADDHPHNVIVKELDLHYQIDQLGSLGETTKWGAA